MLRTYIYLKLWNFAKFEIDSAFMFWSCETIEDEDLTIGLQANESESKTF